MELRDYFYIAVKWWWLFLLCTVLGAGAAFLVSSNMTPVYEASTLLMIGGGVDVVNPTTGELQTSEKLAQTYAELLKTRPVCDPSRIPWVSREARRSRSRWCVRPSSYALRCPIPTRSALRRPPTLWPRS